MILNNTTIERNEMFELAFCFITETAENIFLTGKAGTGKTTFLKYLRDNCTKNIIVAAPTGVAAINAGGVTLHSLFQLPFHPFLPTRTNREDLLKKIRYNKQRLQLLRRMELLVIDEISMVRCDVVDAIDTLLRSVRRNFDTAFGGVQLLCIGDLHQLPPVAQPQEWNVLQEYYGSPFFFESMAIKEQMPLLIELNTIYRQKEASFVSLLNKVRTNNMTADDFEDLHQRFIPGFNPVPDEKFITLTSHNKQADLINNSEIQKLLKPHFIYAAVIENEFAENLYPADAQLMLKVGAQVMFLKNDALQKRYFNGKIGVVHQLEKDRVVVDCDGQIIDVPMETWENSRYTLNRNDGKLEQEVLGSFSQFPLRLAWAITIHKSQGLTFDRLMIDAGSAFSSGQVYVALSRCTSLNGIVLLSKIPSAAIYSNENVIKGQESLTHKGSLEDRFAGARQIFTQQLLENIFSFPESSEALQSLKFNIDLNREKLSAGAADWINTVNENISLQKRTGEKFIRQVYELMKEEPVIEKNDLLQQRVSAAAAHFLPVISSLLKTVKEHTLFTEHKEVADTVNEYLNTAALALFAAHYFLEYCISPFSVTTFLQHKLNFATPRLNLSCYAGSRKQVYTDSPNPELYEELKRWRDNICEETGLPIFMLVTHSGLKDICTMLPKNKRDLLLIQGFGKTKVDKYGDEILDAVLRYREKHNIESVSAAAAVSKPKKEKKVRATTTKVDTKTISYNLFTEGKTIEEIAKERGLANSTIESHMAFFLEKGDVMLDRLVSSDKQHSILSAMNAHPGASLSDIKILLPDISFGEMRFVVAEEKKKIGNIVVPDQHVAL